MVKKIRNMCLKYPIIKEAFLYGLIGATAATLDAATYYLLTRNFGINEFVSNFIGINLGITLSFYLNSFYNFKKTDKLRSRAVKFFTIGYFGLLLSMIILFLGTRVLLLNDLYVKLASVFIVAAFQFVLNKLVTYKEEKNV